MRIQLTKPGHVSGGYCVTRGFVMDVKDGRGKYLVGMGDAVLVDESVPVSSLPPRYKSGRPEEDKSNDIKDLADILKAAIARPEQIDDKHLVKAKKIIKDND